MSRVLLLLILITPLLLHAQDESDCVFNDDYEGLTKDWIKEANTSYQFDWIEEANTAIAQISPTERIELQKGGCYHSVVSLVYRTGRNLEDLEFWLERALALSKEFDLIFYEYLIEGTVGEMERRNNYLIFPIPVEEYSNRDTDGIVLQPGERTNALILEYYYN